LTNFITYNGLASLNRRVPIQKLLTMAWPHLAGGYQQRNYKWWPGLT